MVLVVGRRDAHERRTEPETEAGRRLGAEPRDAHSGIRRAGAGEAYRHRDACGAAHRRRTLLPEVARVSELFGDPIMLAAAVTQGQAISPWGPPPPGPQVPRCARRRRTP